MLREEILGNWNRDLRGKLQKIQSLDSSEYKAYTLRDIMGYGVAIPMDIYIEVNEDFANAKLSTINYIIEGQTEATPYLTLMADDNVDKKAFSALCEQFVFPGTNGKFRRDIVEAPIKWWMEMKQILGNKNVDEMVYDTLGELWVYDYLIRRGYSVEWNGPKGGSVDIESSDIMAEVKSTLSRSKKEITIHGKNQLKGLQNKRLFLYFCVFEMAASTGYSINDIVYGLADDGYNVSQINRLLEKKGLGIGKSARDKRFILWNVYRYIVDDSFPRITESSFVNGREPDGITSISYTVDLEGLPYELIVDGSIIR